MLRLCANFTLMPSRRISGFRVVIYPNDHRPAHVHVIDADGEAVFELGLGGNVELREVRGRMKDPDVVRAYRVVLEHNDSLLEWWREIHGDA